MRDLIFKGIVKPSRYFAVLLLTLHSGCVCMIYLFNISWFTKMVLLVSSLASMAYYWLRDVSLRLPFSWREVSLYGGMVTVRMQDGSQRIGVLSSKSLAVPQMVILRVTFEGAYFSASRVIFRDTFNSEQFRQTRVLLLMGNAIPAAPSPASAMIRHQ